MFKHLLVPTDGSDLSVAAIQMAVALAKEHQAAVTAVHVMPEFHVLTYESEMLGDSKERFIQVVRQHAEAYLATVSVAAAEAGVACETVAVTHDRPYEAIINIAAQRGCDLVVMASHGRSGVRGLLIGSETQKVLTHCSIPVLVVRTVRTVQTSTAPQPHSEETAGATKDASSQSSIRPFVSL
ncbi:universal stress protein [Burkholderia stagnalis]|uniref:Universal stress protein n=1 Tax=Burkholderia stagnalis TaxID=1503054 RepID=A0A6L3MS96_9BURK|nr:universal stress protein [Burkholderia stagnalis]KAB0633976.1 universal stress protein [Burkholderia stagnalis]KVO35266.1 universal stress protein [Burkholderia stagnalis]KVO67221.1 universal stress protein [Burkholderia stagnalis]KVW59906.1 universal stress protein [Burkholderia stagnalis]KVW74185.1 universal stress protein [Burkholderia stagnalis]